MSKSEYVVLVDDATNDDPWGPTGAQMDEITRVFHSGSGDIMEELELRIKNRSASWRRCYKTLLVLDHLARNVHENCLPDICRLIPLFRNVATTFHCNQGGQDHGLSVRERSRKLADLLSDPIMLKDERAKSEAVRKKVQGIEGSGKPDVPQEVRRIEPFIAQTKPNATGTYDPYVPASSRADSRQRDVLREEQEKADLALAMKLQAEENQRAPQTAAQPPVTTAPSKQRVVAARPIPTVPTAGLSQEELDLRLAIEIQRRLDAGEELSPTLFQQHTAQTAAPSQKQPQQVQQASSATVSSPQPGPSDDFASFFAPQAQPSQAKTTQPASFDPFAVPASATSSATRDSVKPPSDDFFNQYLNQRAPQAPSAAQGIDLFSASTVPRAETSFFAATPAVQAPPAAHQQLDLFSHPATVAAVPPQQPQNLFPFASTAAPPTQVQTVNSAQPPSEPASSGQMLQQLGFFSGSSTSNSAQQGKTLGEIVAEKKGAW